MPCKSATKTIAHARAAGETALTIHCLGQGCHHQAVKTFEELRLWNDMMSLTCRSTAISFAQGCGMYAGGSAFDVGT